MTAPDGSSPDGSLGVGGFAAWQAATENDAKAQMKGGVISSWEDAESEYQLRVVDPIDNAYTVAVSAQGYADQAVTEAQAAANAAAVSQATAASFYKFATYWETEFVVASAGVQLGVNELLIGPVQNVPTGLERTITDLHVAFRTQPAGLTFELKKWSDDGLTTSVLDTFTLTANEIRANWSELDFDVVTGERVYVNVTSVTGTVAPEVLQILIFGVLFDPELQPPD